MYQYLNLIRSKINLKNFSFFNDKLILGISGGQDSSLLYLIISILENQYNFKVYLVYCNHSWQKNSILTQQNLIKFSFLTNDFITVFIPFTKLTNETKSRSWRYTVFQRVNLFSETNSYLSGHTSTDLIESFLFYLNRGTGPKIITHLKRTSLPCIYKKLNFFTGKRIVFLSQKIEKINNIEFTSLEPIKVYKLLQPLNRYEVYRLVNYFKLPVWVDQTNFSMRHSRNRIRYQLLPLLRFYFNRNVDISLTKFMNILSDEITFLENLTMKLQTQSTMRHQKQSFHYTFSFFFNCPYIFQKRILLQNLSQIGLTKVSFFYTELILKILYSYFYSNKNNRKQIVFLVGKKLKLILDSSSFCFIQI